MGWDPSRHVGLATGGKDTWPEAEEFFGEGNLGR